MANKVVFDASALIALFAKEAGYEVVRQHMQQAMISCVNLAEVYKYCMETQKLTEKDCRNLTRLSGIKVFEFCEEQALITAKIVSKTKQYGLSLGDRACIALAIYKNCTVLTCDKIWQKVDIDVEFIMTR